MHNKARPRRWVCRLHRRRACTDLVCREYMQYPPLPYRPKSHVVSTVVKLRRRLKQ